MAHRAPYSLSIVVRGEESAWRMASVPPTMRCRPPADAEPAPSTRADRMPQMKLTILGASGGIGCQLVQQAVTLGHEVTALVRSSTPFDAPPAVRVLRGEALNAHTLRDAIRGSDAVVSALGQRRAGLSPWAQLLSPRDLMAGCSRSIEATMRCSVSGPTRPTSAHSEGSPHCPASSHHVADFALSPSTMPGTLFPIPHFK